MKTAELFPLDLYLFISVEFNDKQNHVCTVRVSSPPTCSYSFNPIALRKAKIALNFGLSESNRVNKLRIWS